ncbi:RNA-directed DNA polymerase from mobile element jockey [Plakobranchus ocellatus]|uniref:RNA-directed DNA polymerase from mobile element jockey n=1 Tax=Plakobranchus ocellatus TaxID=259542 RepID=A0AAV4CMS9_9GAST|nr:RNA-directed DNA polymerase from mobile element jockey [Plakobranchus ocellatus]
MAKIYSIRKLQSTDALKSKDRQNFLIYIKLSTITGAFWLVLILAEALDVDVLRQRIYTEPALHLDGQPIPVKGEAKFLGVVFDSKLNFSSHVKYLKKNA